MLTQSLFLVLVCLKVVSPVIITSPGMHRKGLGESCTFKWVVQGSFESYSVSNRSTGETGALSSNANHARDEAKGIIILTILNVQLRDAGNYSLSINAGTSTTTDNGALLFVYGNPSNSLRQTNGSMPAIEGSRVELTCSVTSSSLPIRYRPKIYYSWNIGYLLRLRNISGEPAVLPNGDLLTGYNFTNDGRTLVIDSVQYDDRVIRCCGQEEGIRYECSLVAYVINLHYRPRVASSSPPNRRFDTDLGNKVQLSISVSAVPALTNWTWIFVNTNGVQTTLAPDSIQSSNSLSFTLSLQTYYGSYMYTAKNGIGSTIEMFKVLPPAPPETPSRFNVIYATNSQILLDWHCMWFNGRKQTVSVQLKETAGNTEIETRNATVGDSCYNTTSETLFQKNIRPETSYDVSIWSTNALGSSDVVKLSVTTQKRVKFVVSSKTIAINGTQATIDFSTSNGNVTRVSVTCCPESTGTCNSHTYPIVSGIYRVVYDDLPYGDVYLFDFVVYGGKSRHYYLTMVKGIRVSRKESDDDESTAPLLIATSVLAVLLGIAVLALVGGLLFFLVRRRRETQPPPNLPPVEEQPQRELPKRPLPERKSTVPVTKKKTQKPSAADDEQEEMYEVADAPTSPDDDRFYMPLNEKPTRAKKNQYS